MKSNLHVSAMSLESREGAYTSLGIKVMSYLMLLQVSISQRRTFIKYNFNSPEKNRFS
ncbi:MAG: hypothetical protein OXH00_15485 [Candidatus Poribacteria bacterium]|nr:hypothetical protein [Candidatus Poribacteria bacterium]